MTIRKTGRRRGFTLLELVVVIFLIILMATVILPSLGRLIQFNQEAQAYNLSACMITLTRSEAMRTSQYLVMHAQPCNGFTDIPKVASCNTSNTTTRYLVNFKQDSTEPFSYPDILDRQALVVGKYLYSGDNHDTTAAIAAGGVAGCQPWPNPPSVDQYNSCFNLYAAGMVYTRDAAGNPYPASWSGSAAPWGERQSGQGQMSPWNAPAAPQTNDQYCRNDTPRYRTLATITPVVMPGSYAIGEISSTFVDGSGDYAAHKTNAKTGTSYEPFNLGDNDHADISAVALPNTSADPNAPPNDGIDDGIEDFMTFNIMFAPQGQVVNSKTGTLGNSNILSEGCITKIRMCYVRYGYFSNGDSNPTSGSVDDEYNIDQTFYGRRALCDAWKWSHNWDPWGSDSPTGRPIWDKSRGEYGVAGVTLFDSSKLRAIGAGNGKTAGENRADYLNKNGQIIPINRYNGLLFPRK